MAMAAPGEDPDADDEAKRGATWKMMKNRGLKAHKKKLNRCVLCTCYVYECVYVYVYCCLYSVLFTAVIVYCIVCTRYCIVLSCIAYCIDIVVLYGIETHASKSALHTRRQRCAERAKCVRYAQAKLGTTEASNLASNPTLRAVAG